MTRIVVFRRMSTENHCLATIDDCSSHDVYETQQRLFIVMRLVDGPSLEELIATRGRLAWTESVGIITAVAEGLD